MDPIRQAPARTSGSLCRPSAPPGTTHRPRDRARSRAGRAGSGSMPLQQRTNPPQRRRQASRPCAPSCSRRQSVGKRQPIGPPAGNQAGQHPGRDHGEHQVHSSALGAASVSAMPKRHCSQGPAAAIASTVASTPTPTPSSVTKRAFGDQHQQDMARRGADRAQHRELAPPLVQAGQHDGDQPGQADERDHRRHREQRASRRRRPRSHSSSSATPGRTAISGFARDSR